MYKLSIETPSLNKLQRVVAALEGSAVRAYMILFDSKGEGSVMNAVVFKDTEGPFNAVVGFLDARNNPTTPDTVPVWTSSDESVVTVDNVSEDGLSATVTLTGALGNSEVRCEEQETSESTGETAPVAAAVSITVEASDAVTGDIELTPQA